MPANTPAFDQLPDSAFIRQSHLVSNPKRPSLTLLPFSANTLWRMVKSNSFPAPVRLSDNVVAWRVGDVRRWLAQQAIGGAA
jgi:prophage regulatory protein